MISELDIRARIVQFLYNNPGSTKSAIYTNVQGAWTRKNNAIRDLEADNCIVNVAHTQWKGEYHLLPDMVDMVDESIRRIEAKQLPPPPPPYRPAGSQTFQFGNVSLKGEFALCIQDGELTLGIHTDSGSYYMIGEAK